MMKSAPATNSKRLSAWEMIEEVIDLSAGVGILLLPLLVTAVPGLLLFFALPAMLLLAVTAVPAIVLGVIAVPPYLLARAVRRRRRARATGCRSSGEPPMSRGAGRGLIL